ncbi:MAG: hypothetical protein CMJ39_06920 [Phycisphaerae bacterium]|nr:hypothetical protein [Phycisphaerae bacterium]|tara:strand:- start:394 stop:2667 length:2274 start_codon:yes stop_codon:yes gene_type:complete
MNILTILLSAVLSFDPAPIIQWGGAHSGADQTHVQLITDAQGLEEAWKRVHSGSIEGQPQVNFDQCRLVLTLRGTAMNIQRVVATAVETTDDEIILTLDPISTDGGQNEETTAWGLYVIPASPEIVRVGYYDSVEEDREWQTITVLGPDARSSMFDGRHSGSHQDADRPPRFVPDLNLLQPRRASDRDEDVKGSPHAMLFRHGNKQLLFIGAVHQRDIENAPTHRMVRKAIEGFRPQVVIVEGLNTSEGTQPERFMNNARRRLKSGQMGESPYAAVLGDEIGALIIGGEPDPQATTDMVREAGYSDDDLMGFLVARNVTSMVRNDRNAENYDRRITRAIENLKRRFAVDSDMDVDDFKAWYQDRIGKPFTPRWVRREVSPQLVDEPSILRSISILSMKAREYNLVELEARMLEEHDRVMVVYGSGHLRWERALLEDMLGEPVLVTTDLSIDMFDNMDEHLERIRAPWTSKLDAPPNYFISHGYDPRWSDDVKAGIEVTRDYLGNYGPLQIYILGQEEDELEDPEHQDEIARVYCDIHNAGSDRPMEDCLSGEGRELAQKALDGATEAYMTMAMDSDPPCAELVFINAHKFGGDDMPTRGIHEYTHVYQKAFDFTPTWMMEGGAELLACHLGEKHGWGERDQTMEWYARHLEEIGEIRYTIRDMEEIETAGPAIAAYHRQLGYDAGAWAVAYLISRTPSRSIGTYFREYFPMVDRLGWKEALCESTDVSNIDEFYEGYEIFMDKPLRERLDVLRSLND